MKKHLFILAAVFALAAPAMAKSSHAVRSHVTKKGTFVKASHATNPNKTKRDNYSHKGNVNPYTGAAGTKN